MSELVKIILDADNKASGPINQLGKSLGSLGSLAGGALKLGLMAGTTAMAGMTAALGFMVKGAMEAELAEAQLDATLRSTAKAAADYAAAAAVQITGPRESADAVNAYRAELDQLTMAYELDGAQLQEQRQRLIALTAAWGADALNVKTDTAELRIAEAEHAKMGASINSLQRKIASGSELVTRSQAEMLNMIKPALQLTRGELLEYAEAMQKVTRFDDEVILGGESLLLTFTSIGKDVFPAAIEVAMDMSTVFGTDLQSSITQVGKALQDPILGITALRRVGVNFNEAQTAVIKKMVESGNAAGAQAAILKELQTEFGGSAKGAGKTFAGQLDILKKSLGEVTKAAGKPLLDKLSELAAGMLTLVQSPGFKVLTDTFMARILDTTDAVGKLWEAIATGGAKSGLTALLGLAQGGAPVGGGKEKPGAQEGFGAMVPTGIIDASQADTIKALFDDLQLKWLALQPSLAAFVKWLETELPRAVQTFKLFWDENLAPPIQNLWNSLSDEKTGLMPALKLVSDWLSVNVPTAITKFNLAFGGGKTSVHNFITETDTLVKRTEGVLGALSAFGSALDTIAKIAETIVYWYTQWYFLLGLVGTKPGLPPGAPTMPGPPKMASGTSFAPGGWALVGEQGPELAYVPRGAHIWPYGQGPSRVGGGGQVLTLVYSPMISLASEDEVMDRLVPLLRRAGVAV